MQRQKPKKKPQKKQTEAKKPASQPAKPANNTPSTPSKPTRTDKDYYGVALAIWNGNYGWGTGNTRVSRLKAKGFDANRVQSIVNQMGREVMYVLVRGLVDIKESVTFHHIITINMLSV